MTDTTIDPADWLVQIAPKEAPMYRECSDAVQQIKDELIGLWSKYVTPVSNDGNGDVEDFFEMAYRLKSAIDAFGVEHIYLLSDEYRGVVTRLRDGAVFDMRDVAHLRRYGMQAVNGFLGETDMDYRAGDYMPDKSFSNNAGRKVVLAGCYLEDDTEVDLFDSVYDLFSQGHMKVVIKTRQTKKGLWFLDFTADMTREDIDQMIREEMDWTLIMYEGSPEMFSVQTFAPMRFEYRCFVVNHQVVTAAGCIEEFTPLDNTSQFDAQLREFRRGRSAVVTRPDIVKRLVAFAQEVASEGKKEHPDLTMYTLDVAMDENNAPLVIERNGIMNSGMYASQPWQVTFALN